MKHIILSAGIGSLFFLQGGSALAQQLENPLKAESIIELMNTILDVIMVFAVPIIVFFIVYSGFLFVTARGNEQTLAQAKRALLYAVIGGVIILGAKIILEVIEGTVSQF